VSSATERVAIWISTQTPAREQWFGASALRSTTMPYRAPVVGHCDRLGYARCLACHERAEVESDFVIVGDNGAFANDRCDACGKPFSALREANAA
jgi:hypothetical protein